MAVDYLAKMLMEEVEALKPKAEAYDKLMAEGKRKVFIVTSREDDDYSIEAVFSSEDKAKEYCDVNTVSEPFVYFRYTEYLIDDYTVKHPVIYEVAYYPDCPKDGQGSMEFNRVEEHANPWMHANSWMEEWNVFVCTVEYNKDVSVMEASVYKKYREYTEQQKGNEQ